MKAVVIGGTKGIGLALAHQLVAKHAFSLVCITGRSAPKEQLPSQIHFVEMDLGALDLVPSLENVKRVVGTSIEAAFICAAVGGGSGEWDKVSAEDMMSTFRVNVVGPVMCAQHLVPLLKEGKQRLLVNVTSRMGSIDDNSSGKYAAYRTSKASLNMWTKSLSIEVPWLRSIAYHPGIVNTDLLQAMIGVENAKKSGKDPAVAAEELLRNVADLNVKSGSFLSWDGKIIPN